MIRKAFVLSMLLLSTVAAAPTAGVAAADGPLESHGGDGTTCDFPYQTTDATGTEVRIPEDPERVVTLNPSAAQTMWEIGARDEVVGVSQYAAYLDGASEKENVSGANGPSVEAVVALSPDLVLVPNSTHGFAPERVAQIRAQGIPVYVYGEATSLSQVAADTERTGRLTGNCAAGVERADEMRRSLALMRRVLDDADRPVGLNVFYGYTSGADTFIGDVMETAGVENGAAEAGISGFKSINDETVAETNPTWIVVPEGSQVPASPAYNSTTAVREGNVVRVNTNYLQQPAPRSVLAAERILEAAHPDAYTQYRELKASGGAAATTESGSEPHTDTDSPTGTPTSSPGFGAVTAAVALAAVASLSVRR